MADTGARLTAIDLGPNNQLGIKCRPDDVQFLSLLYLTRAASAAVDGNRVSWKSGIFREVKACQSDTPVSFTSPSYVTHVTQTKLEEQF